MTKPSRNSAAMTASVAPATPPGRLVSARSTMVSPPRPRNTRLNKVAPIRIRKIMLVICVVRTITGIEQARATPDRKRRQQDGADGAHRRGFGRRRHAAEDGAEHGEDQRDRRDREPRSSRRASAKPRGASGSGAIAGDFFGKKIAMPIR